LQHNLIVDGITATVVAPARLVVGEPQFDPHALSPAQLREKAEALPFGSSDQWSQLPRQLPSKLISPIFIRSIQA
jgi:hypothetical protein